MMGGASNQSGVNNNNAVLCDTSIKLIFRLFCDGLSLQEIAGTLVVSTTTIREVLERKRWKEVLIDPEAESFTREKILASVRGPRRCAYKKYRRGHNNSIPRCPACVRDDRNTEKTTKISPALVLLLAGSLPPRVFPLLLHRTSGKHPQLSRRVVGLLLGSLQP